MGCVYDYEMYCLCVLQNDGVANSTYRITVLWIAGVLYLVGMYRASCVDVQCT